MSREEHRVRVLVAHAGLLTKRDENAEIADQIAGLLLAHGGRMDVYATDGRVEYRPVFQGGTVEYLPVRPLHDGIAAGYDVAHIHMPVPITHLFLAIRLRLRRTPVVLSPMAMLNDDFSRRSWFKPRSRLFAVAKPSLVRLLRTLWRISTSYTVCLSGQELRLGHFRPDRAVIVPWTTPATSLSSAATATDRAFVYEGQPDMPIAFVNRLDWTRKGFDRLCDWLQAKADELPRPAVALFAPRVAGYPRVLDELVEKGLIQWHDYSYGSDLLPELEQCRGLLLLSRWDGQSRILREAAVAGIPTISTSASHFEEAVELLGCGAIVPGDDIDALQAAYEGVVHDRVDRHLGARLFHRENVGAFLGDVLIAVARGAEPPRSYFVDRRSASLDGSR